VESSVAEEFVIAPAERHALVRAVALAQRAVVRASPNPGVGCVITRGGAIVGEGATDPPGGPHAEVVALRSAGDRAAGATVHVTLEPCAHHGRTPPCVDALVDAGVARVVVAHPDPNPAAAGGIARLRAAGIEVVGPLDATDPVRLAVAAQLEGFLSLVTRGRPHLTLKLAQTADGSLVAPGGARWLTGPAARASVHRWRAVRDAVLVGSGTVIADDPSLDARDVPVVRQPRPVVFDGRLRTTPEHRVARPGALVVTSDRAPRDRADALREVGVEVVIVAAGVGGGVALPEAFAALGRAGIATVFAEPGASLAAALVAGHLVDRLVLHVAAHLGDGEPRRAVPSPPGGVWRTERSGGAGRDAVLHLVPAPGPATSGPARPAASTTATVARTEPTTSRRAEEVA
jgi:diaminohydroxyphosphoribosylaminopyrimidine deaminase / 5-amino-6-(5-phosphoribosylamino)uracil reductase